VISFVVAYDLNGTIGRNGALPWRLPDDLARFRALTLGHSVVMGRKTRESIGHALGGRRNVVLSRDPKYVAELSWMAPTITDALDVAASNDADVFVIGGAEVYAAALPYVERAYITSVNTRVEGDNLTRFPCDLSSWRVVESERHEADARHAHAFTFETLVRP